MDKRCCFIRCFIFLVMSSNASSRSVAQAEGVGSLPCFCKCRQPNASQTTVRRLTAAGATCGIGMPFSERFPGRGSCPPSPCFHLPCAKGNHTQSHIRSLGRQKGTAKAISICVDIRTHMHSSDTYVYMLGHVYMDVSIRGRKKSAPPCLSPSPAFCSISFLAFPSDPYRLSKAGLHRLWVFEGWLAPWHLFQAFATTQQPPASPTTSHEPLGRVIVQLKATSFPGSRIKQQKRFR